MTLAEKVCELANFMGSTWKFTAVGGKPAISNEHDNLVLLFHMTREELLCVTLRNPLKLDLSRDVPVMVGPGELSQTVQTSLLSPFFHAQREEKARQRFLPWHNARCEELRLIAGNTGLQVRFTVDDHEGMPLNLHADFSWPRKNWVVAASITAWPDHRTTHLQIYDEDNLALHNTLRVWAQGFPAPVNSQPRPWWRHRGER